MINQSTQNSGNALGYLSAVSRDRQLGKTMSSQLPTKPNARNYLSAVSNPTIPEPQSISKFNIPGISKKPELMSEKNKFNLFSDEQEAFSKMLQDGLKEDEAQKLIKDRREDLLGGDTAISQEEAQALIKMRDDNLTSQEAVNLLQEYRQDKPIEKDTRPMWKKAGETALKTTTGYIGEATMQIGNIIDFATLGKTGIKEQITGVEEQLQKSGVSDSTSGKVGGAIFNVGSAFALPTLKGGLVTSGIKTGALYGGLTPIAEQGSETKLGDIAKSTAIGGVVGGAIGGAIKGVGATAKYIKNKLPTELQLSGLLNPSKLQQVNKTLIQEGQKTPENVGKWMLDRNIKGSKENIITQLKDRATQSKTAVDDVLATIDDTTKLTYANDDVTKALTQIKEDLSKSVGMEGAVKEIDALLQKGRLTLTEINKAKRYIDDAYNLFTKAGGETAGLKAEGLRNIRANIKNFIENTAEANGAPNIKLLNNETQVSRALADAIEMKESGDFARELLSPFAGGVIGGLFGPNIGPFDGNTTEGRVMNVIFGALIGKGLASTSLKTNVAGALNKMSKQEISTLDSFIQSGGKTSLGKEITSKLSKKIKGFLPAGKTIIPEAPKGTSTIKVTDSVIQPNVSRGLPELPPAGQTTKQAIITPQTAEKGVIQESKASLKNTKIGTTNNTPTTKEQLALPQGKVVTPQTIAKGKDYEQGLKDKAIIEESKKGLPKPEKINESVNRVEMYKTRLESFAEKLFRGNKSGKGSNITSKQDLLQYIKDFGNDINFIEAKNKTIQETYSDFIGKNIEFKNIPNELKVYRSGNTEGLNSYSFDKNIANKFGKAKEYIVNKNDIILGQTQPGMGYQEFEIFIDGGKIKPKSNVGIKTLIK